MQNPLSLANTPDLVDKKVRKVYIKDGKRLMTTSDGYMYASADMQRRMFGKHRGGKYSRLQEKSLV